MNRKAWTNNKAFGEIKEIAGKFVQNMLMVRGVGFEPAIRWTYRKQIPAFPLFSLFVQRKC
jgi:hypothetical protein